MTEQDDFFERLRRDAQSLQRRPDAATLARIHARIEARLAPRLAPRETVMDLLALWFRPVALAMSAVALTATIGIAAYTLGDARSYDDSVQIVMGGETYRVGR